MVQKKTGIIQFWEERKGREVVRLFCTGCMNCFP